MLSETERKETALYFNKFTGTFFLAFWTKGLALLFCTEPGKSCSRPYLLALTYDPPKRTRHQASAWTVPTAKPGDCLEPKSQHSLFSVFSGAQDWLVTSQRWFLTQMDFILRQIRPQGHFRNGGQAHPFTQGKTRFKSPGSGDCQDWNPSSALKNHVTLGK